MSVLVTASAVHTCLGDGAETFAALRAGEAGGGDLREGDPIRLNVLRGYHVAAGPSRFRASRWLGDCVREALAQAGVDPARERVTVVVGTGLRELRELERLDEDGGELETERLHFGAAVRAAAPGVEEVVTLCNACSAGGHALALAQDLVELGEADAVVAAAADSMTLSMLAMIGLVSPDPADALRPFDRARGGALLGEGAAALVVEAERPGRRALARVLATGMSCDAHHETAAEAGGVRRAVDDAFARARRAPQEVDLVIAHGTGTAINDPLECELVRAAYGDRSGRPLVTAIKGAVGHTSGAAALMSVDVAIRCLREGVVPPIVGLRSPIVEAGDMALVRDAAVTRPIELAQVDAFGFGGVNAVTLLEAA
jgi:3-oxoacyl-[acyl-carrier-protein] synthase II